MLTGKLPFKGEHEQAVVYSVLKEKPKPVTDIKSEIPTSIEQVVSKALEKDPDKRYQQIDELIDDIKSISAGIVPEEIRARIKKEKLRKRKKTFLYGRAATLVTAAVVLAILFFTGPAESIDSIAVLPMENLTGDADQQYFVDGVTDALIGQLGQISGLHQVISRTSMMRYKDTDKSLSEIAQELHVDALVEGAVYPIGENVSIKLQLFDALPEERSLWTQRYDRPVNDVLVMYAGTARTIAENIQVKLAADETSRFDGARQVNPESYDAYLKGLTHVNKLTPEEIKIAQQYFDLALEIEPNNPLAHVGVSLVWMIRYQMGIAPRQEALPLTKAAIGKSLELDNTLAEAHWALGSIKCWDEWDWEGAEKEFQQAYRLNPNHAGAHGAYSHLLCYLGRIDEALPHIELALELAPLNPMWHLFYGIVLSHHRRYDDAIAAYRAALDIVPNYPIALGNLADALGEKGMYNEELAIWRRIYADDAELSMALDDGFEKAGYKGAYRALADLKVEWYGNPGKSIAAKEIAYDYNKAGDYDLAIDWFEKAYEEHDPNLPYMIMLGNPLRSNPRFQELLRKMNLPPGK